MVVTRSGKDFLSLRRIGKKLVPLPNLPYDDPEFLEALAEARRATGAPVRSRAAPGSIDALIQAVTVTERYKSRSKVYRATLTRQFEAIREDAGTAPVPGLRDRHIRKNVRGCEKQPARLKAWRYLMAWAEDAGLVEVDPSLSVREERKKVIGSIPWSLDEIDSFRARWPIGSAARLAFEVLYWTGARREDATKLRPGMIGRDGILSFDQGKSEHRNEAHLAYIPWTCPLPGYVLHCAEDREYLHACLDARKERHMTSLATEQGASRSPNGLGNLIVDAAKSAGAIGRSPHGLR